MSDPVGVSDDSGSRIASFQRRNRRETLLDVLIVFSQRLSARQDGRCGGGETHTTHPTSTPYVPEYVSYTKHNLKNIEKSRGNSIKKKLYE